MSDEFQRRLDAVVKQQEEIRQEEKRKAEAAAQQAAALIRPARTLAFQIRDEIILPRLKDLVQRLKLQCSLERPEDERYGIQCNCVHRLGPKSALKIQMTAHPTKDSVRVTVSVTHHEHGIEGTGTLLHAGENKFIVGHHQQEELKTWAENQLLECARVCSQKLG